jgi:hypothetical protein
MLAAPSAFASRSGSSISEAAFHEGAIVQDRQQPGISFLFDSETMDGLAAQARRRSRDGFEARGFSDGRSARFLSRLCARNGSATTRVVSQLAAAPHNAVR